MRMKGDGEIQRSGEKTAGRGPLYGAGSPHPPIARSPFGRRAKEEERGEWGGADVGGDGDPKKKGGAPFDAPPCGFLGRAYFISPGAGAGAGAGVTLPPGAALAPWFAAYSASWRNVGLP
jgi:hypothetical protein